MGTVTALAAAALLVTGGTAGAHGHDGATGDARTAPWHGGLMQHDAGHLLPRAEHVELVSELELGPVEPNGIGDVGVYGDYAYLAARAGDAHTPETTCVDTGIHVVDISDPATPEEVSFIPAPAGSHPGEGVQAITISTPSFAGDVLVTNNEFCAEGGAGGINIYDVTDPAQPRVLAEGFGDLDPEYVRSTAHQTHSVFAWDAGDRAYAVMVDDEEGPDVDIVDITDPTQPALVAEHELDVAFPEIAQPDQGLDEVFLHDMIVKETDGRFLLLASYWDGGYVQLDVTDPTAPAYLADSDFPNPDSQAAERGLTVPPEGNAHQAEFTRDNAHVIGADEDFAPYALSATNVTDGTAIDAAAGEGAPVLEQGQEITGQGVYVGRSCTLAGDPAVPAGDGTQIAVVERGICPFTEKVAAVEAAGGYVAVLVFNQTGQGGCNSPARMLAEGQIPTFGVAPREQGLAIFDVAYDDEQCLAGTGEEVAPIEIGTAGDELSFSSYFDGWGYVRLFDAEMNELDTYAIDEAFDPAFAEGFGHLSVHEVATSQVEDTLAYLAYYSGGLRVIDVAGGQIDEVGVFIDEGGNDFWGVESFVRDDVEYAALSDRDFGLYIVQYTGQNP